MTSDSPGEWWYEPEDDDREYCEDHARFRPCRLCGMEQNGADAAERD